MANKCCKRAAATLESSAWMRRLHWVSAVSCVLGRSKVSSNAAPRRVHTDQRKCIGGCWACARVDEVHRTDCRRHSTGSEHPCAAILVMHTHHQSSRAHIWPASRAGPLQPARSRARLSRIRPIEFRQSDFVTRCGIVRATIRWRHEQARSAIRGRQLVPTANKFFQKAHPVVCRPLHESTRMHILGRI